MLVVLALAEAARDLHEGVFHGVLVRASADTLLRSLVQHRACYLFRTSESSRGFVVLSRKRTSIRGDAFWHTLFGHHRPGEAVLAARRPARGQRR